MRQPRRKHRRLLTDQTCRSHQHADSNDPESEASTVVDDLRQACIAGGPSDDDAPHIYGSLDIQRRVRRIHKLLLTSCEDQGNESMDCCCPESRVDDSSDPTSTNKAFRGSLIATLDIQLVRQIHGLLVLLLSQAMSDHTRHCQDHDRSAHGSASLLEICVQLICDALSLIYEHRLLPHQVCRDMMVPEQQYLSSLECQQVFDTVVSTLELVHHMQLQPLHRVDREDKDAMIVCEEPTKGAWQSFSTCISVLDKLAPYIQSATVDQLLFILQTCYYDGEEQSQLLTGSTTCISILNHLVDSPDDATSHMARTVRSALANADAPWNGGCHHDPLETLLYLRCILYVRTKALSTDELVTVLEQLEGMVCAWKDDRSLACQAMDCFALLWTQHRLHPNDDDYSQYSMLASIKRIILVCKSWCPMHIKRRLLLGLEWCSRRQLISQLLVADAYDHQSNSPKVLVAFLVELILSSMKPTKSVSHPIHTIRTQREEVIATRVLTSVFSAGFEHKTSDSIHPLATTASFADSISNRDCISIYTVLAEHDNESVVCLCTEALCAQLETGAHDLYAQVPAAFATLGRVVSRFLGGNRHSALVDRIISLWWNMSSTRDSLLSASLTRQPAVLTALLLAISSVGVLNRPRLSAIAILVNLAHDVCNRRILSCYSGLLPC
jgi:hypothetical protein